jgi:uncharacterized membrane protein
MKPFLIVSQAIYAICLLPWFFVWTMSVMAFDQGFHVWNTLYFAFVTVFPVVALVSSILAWVFLKRKPRAAATVNCLPLVWIVAFGIFMLY